MAEKIKAIKKIDIDTDISLIHLSNKKIAIVIEDKVVGGIEKKLDPTIKKEAYYLYSGFFLNTNEEKIISNFIK